MADYAQRAKHNRCRAETVRAIAGEVTQQSTRDILERTARELDKAAEQLEMMAKWDKSPNRDH